MKRFFLAACLIAVSNAAQADTLMLERDIAPGEVFEHDSSVILKGNIGDGAKIIIRAGGMRVLGAVGNNVMIETHAPATAVGTSSSTVVVNSNGNSTVVINGQVVNPSEQEIASGIEIKGEMGSGVHLITDGSINAGVAGKELAAEASGSITAGQIAPRAQLSAGGSIVVGNVGDKSSLNARGSITSGDIGSASNVNAQGSITAGYVDDASLTAGGSIIAQGASDTGKMKAAGHVLIGGYGR